MILFLTKTHPDVVRLRERHGVGVGRLITPRHTSSVEVTAAAGIPWAADNDAFGAWDEARFVAMVDRLRPLAGCRFVAAPDVVADAGATLARFDAWAPLIHPLPVALVAQDGLTIDTTPWDRIAALFVGGSTDWKLGPEAAALAAEATRRGVWVHVGRVNSARRALYVRAIGADSVDGSGLAKFSRAKASIIEQVVAGPAQLLLGGCPS